MSFISVLVYQTGRKWIQSSKLAALSCLHILKALNRLKEQVLSLLDDSQQDSLRIL